VCNRKTRILHTNQKVNRDDYRILHTNQNVNRDDYVIIHLKLKGLKTGNQRYETCSTFVKVASSGVSEIP
jgi:hypothetical protein